MNSRLTLLVRIIRQITYDPLLPHARVDAVASGTAEPAGSAVRHAGSAGSPRPSSALDGRGDKAPALEGRDGKESALECGDTGIGSSSSPSVSWTRSTSGWRLGAVAGTAAFPDHGI